MEQNQRKKGRPKIKTKYKKYKINKILKGS